MYDIPGKLVAAICELNQWAMDFEGNYERICESIIIAKSRGATYRLGPELEITGYNCQDHFLEFDTIAHGYEVLAKILSEPNFHGIVLDIGLPIMHDGVRYNSRAICFNGSLLCIRPKTVLANDGIYHEERWFVGWKQSKLSDWLVPEVIFRVIGKTSVPIGVFVLRFQDVSIGIEMCEELFVPNSLHNLLAMNGAHVICNGNGSHFRLGKISKRFSLVADASGKTGCTYLYGNIQGFDGSTMYFDGGSFVASFGKIVSMLPRFSINSGCLVLISVIDINEIRSRRASVVSLSKAAAECEKIQKIRVPEYLCRGHHEDYVDTARLDPYEVILANNSHIDELVGAPSCYLWDFLRRSGLGGFFVPLSGGADSAVVAALVHFMSFKVFKSIQLANMIEKQKLITTLQEIVRDTSFVPTCPEDISKRILFTAYMGSSNSSEITKLRAERLAKAIYSNHLSIDISLIIDAYLKTLTKSLNISPKFKSFGGTVQEDLSLQNLQSRSRMVLSYLLSQLMPLHLGNSKLPPLLVLGTSNADEVCRGYFTKYDCSSADLSPIAGLGKHHIKQMLEYFQEIFQQDIFGEIAHAFPTAELVPLQDGVTIQNDEDDMGFTYEELRRLREIRATLFCGPLSMFNILLDEWGRKHTNSHSCPMNPHLIADKVKRFFTLYSKNRHKSTILPPSIFMCNDMMDGRHYDMRPFLYNILWTWQFKCIDRWLELRGGNFG